MFSIQTTTLGVKSIFCDTHNHSVPLDPANRHYQEVLDSINTDGADAWDDTVATYADIPEELRTAAEAKKAAADTVIFNQQVEDYRQAVARLEQYALEDGLEEQTITKVVGREWDDTIADFADVTEEVVIPSIAPLPLTVVAVDYDENGNDLGTTSDVTNPDIVKDREERAAAQAVVDATPQAVIDAA